MPVLVTSNFDDDSIKNERASMETPFSHKSMGIFLDAQGQLTHSQWSDMAEIWDFIHVLVTRKYKKDLIKSNQEKVDTISPILSQWGLSVVMYTRVLIQSASKHYAAFPQHYWCYT